MMVTRYKRMLKIVIDHINFLYYISIPRNAEPNSLTEFAISSSNEVSPDETSSGRGSRLNTPLFSNLNAEA
jgi:hypothetical protein